MIVFMTASSSISYNLIDDSLFTNSRYGMIYDALDTIAVDESLSVVAIGSSQMYKAVNGECLGNNSAIPEAKFYNLGISASRSYTDMLMIPRLINSNVDVVMIEVGVNLLFEMKEPIKGYKGDEYLEMRFTIDTMLQTDSDVGEWVEVILPFHDNWVNTNEIQRTEARQLYSIDGMEIIVNDLLEIEENEAVHDRQIPEIGTNEWIDYLQKPSWPSSRFERMDAEARQTYSEEEMSKSLNYHPRANGTANHAALDYEVSSLVNAGIKVILVGLPHHPEVISMLPNGHWDGYNATMRELVDQYDVEMVDLTFSPNWEDHHFSDRNHLDADGREEFCYRMTPILDNILGD
jgi:hypothetical protein